MLKKEKQDSDVIVMVHVQAVWTCLHSGLGTNNAILLLTQPATASFGMRFLRLPDPLNTALLSFWTDWNPEAVSTSGPGRAFRDRENFSLPFFGTYSMHMPYAANDATVRVLVQQIQANHVVLVLTLLVSLFSPGVTPR